MIRVLMIAPTPFFSDRGCHVRIYEEAKYLIDRGHRVALLTYPIGNDPPGLDTQRIPRVSSYDRIEAGPSWHRVYLDALVFFKAWKAVRTFKPDLIHAHLHEGCLIGRLLKARFKLPLIFDYQGSLAAESIDHGFIKEAGFLHKIFERVEGLIDRSADRIIVSGDALAAPLKERGLAVETVADGVDPERFRPGPGDAALRRKLGLPDDRPLAAYLGLLSEYQGTDILLLAARRLKDSGERVHFLVMGFPEDDYKAQASRLGLDDTVTFTGRVDYFQAADYLRLGTIALAPKLARTEGNGKVLLYMACGLPVVAFDIPVNRGILGPDAEWVTPEEGRGECARLLARAVTRILNDRERAQALSVAGRKRAEAELSMEAQGRKLIEVYEGLLEGGA